MTQVPQNPPANVFSFTLQAVEQFALSPTAAAAHIAALAQLTASMSKPDTDCVSNAAEAGQSLPKTAAWGSKVLQAAEDELGQFVEQVNVHEYQY